MSKTCPTALVYLVLACFVGIIAYTCLAQPAPTTLPASQPATQPLAATPFIIAVWQQPISSAAKWKARGFNTLYGHEVEGGRFTKVQWEAQVGPVINFISVPGVDPATESKQRGRVGFSQLDESDGSGHVGLPGNTIPDLRSAYLKVRSSGPLPMYANFDGHAFDNIYYDGRKHRTDINADRPVWHNAADGGYFAQEDYPGFDYHLWTTGRPGAFDITKRLMDRMNDWSGGKPFFVYVETCTQGKNFPFTADDYENQVWTIVNYAKLKGYKLKGIICFTHKIYPTWSSFDMSADDVVQRMPVVNAKLNQMFNSGSTSQPSTDPPLVTAPEELATIRSTVSALQNRVEDLQTALSASNNRITQLEAAKTEGDSRWLRFINSLTATTQPSHN